MLRDTMVTSQDFSVKFKRLKVKLDWREAIHLDSEYHQELKQYIGRLYVKTCENKAFDNVLFNDMRDTEMSNLNRLQKIKNASSYKKDKHKAKQENEDWG